MYCYFFYVENADISRYSWASYAVFTFLNIFLKVIMVQVLHEIKYLLMSENIYLFLPSPFHRQYMYHLIIPFLFSSLWNFLLNCLEFEVNQFSRFEFRATKEEMELVFPWPQCYTTKAYIFIF